MRALSAGSSEKHSKPRPLRGDRTRERGRWPRRIELDSAHAGGSVGHDDRPEAECFLLIQIPSVRSRQEADLLLEGQPADQAGFIAADTFFGAAHGSFRLQAEGGVRPARCRPDRLLLVMSET